MLFFFISLYSKSSGDAALQHVRITWCFHCEAGGDRESEKHLPHCILSVFCLQHVRANKGRDQTFTKKQKYKGDCSARQQLWRVRVRERKEGQRCLKFYESNLALLWPGICCSMLNKCMQGSGAGSWGHGVTQSEGGPADKILGNSARPAPPAQGVTAEYTWPGSFRSSGDNWERPPPRSQPKLTKGIMCGGRSEQSKVDSVNV